MPPDGACCGTSCCPSTRAARRAARAPPWQPPAGAARAVAHANRTPGEHRIVQRADRVAIAGVLLVGPGQHPKRLSEAGQELAELRAEARPDLAQGGTDRVVEDRALQDAEQVLAEGEREDLVGGEGRVADLEGVEEPIEDAVVALLAHQREARVHEGVQVPVDRAAHDTHVLCQLVQADAVAAVREPLDQLPLARELVASQRPPRIPGRFS